MIGVNNPAVTLYSSDKFAIYKTLSVQHCSHFVIAIFDKFLTSSTIEQLLREHTIKSRLCFLNYCLCGLFLCLFLQIKIFRYRHRCQYPQQHEHHHNFNESKTLLPRTGGVVLIFIFFTNLCRS